MPLELNLPAGYYHANMLFTGAAVPRGAAITFGGSAASGTPAAVAAAINTAWNTHLKSIFNTAVSLAGTRVKIGPNVDGPFAYVALGTAGTSAGTAGSPQVAYLIRKNTALGGRQGAGRMYQPGWSETDVDSTGTISGGTRTGLQTAWSAFLAGLSSVSYPMYLLHSHGAITTMRDANLYVRTVAPRAPTEVTSLSVDSVVATQRRRLRG